MSKRVECIVTILERTSADAFDGTSMEGPLKNLTETLEECSVFIEKFADASILNQFVNNSSHQSKFEELNNLLSSNASDLKLALNITSVFDQQQDAADRQADLAEISSKLDVIALELTNQQQKLVHQNKDMKNEFKRRFDSFRFHLEQDILKAQNPVEAEKIDTELKLFPRIPGYDLLNEEQIGQGGFADVYRGKWLSHDHPVAIKTIRITYLRDDVKKNFLDEIATMYKIRFDYVLGIFGACIEPNYYALVVEYMSLGSLFDVLQKKERILSWADRWSIALQMTKGVNYLHMMSILHRDIKSLNFLMDNGVNGYIVKISDFGLAKIRYATSRQTTEDGRQQITGGTLLWKAPELLKFGKPSKASDIYSLGIVFWELATGRVPYEELDETIVSEGVKAGERLEIPKDVPPAFVSIITKSWSQDPSKRPTSQELLQEIATNEPIHLAASPFKDISREEEKHIYRNVSLEEIIVKCPSSSTIKLNDQKITDSDMEIVVQEAIIKKQCRDLWLAHNKITWKGAEILANVLYDNRTLYELWLSSNHLSENGVYYLAKALSVNVTLKKLGLASNDITNAGVCHLVEMFKSNKTLIMLGLANNKIGDEGVQMLAHTLAYQNTSLQTLTLNRNESITDASIPSVINMINKNRSIKELWLNNCSLRETGSRRLQELAKSRPDLKLVTVYEHSS